MKKNERLQALKCLSTLLHDKISLSQQSDFKALSPLSKNLCFGVCRHYFSLAELADLFLKKRLKPIEIWVNVLMGLYQLHYLKTPSHAAVHETVGLLDSLNMTWAKGLVNAVLRNYCRRDETTQVGTHDHPRWLIERLKVAWPTDWETILEANNIQAPMTLRVNIQQVTRTQYLEYLKEQGIQATPLCYSAQGLTLEKACPVEELPGFREGLVSVQDEAAQLAVSLLALQPDLRILDACAAPGGKTCHILETEPHLQELIAMDIDERRLKRIQENITRLKLHATLQCGDVLKPETWWDGQPFDRILLDAPCSATGVIRRHPDIKLLRQEKDICEITKIQAKMLRTLWPILAQNGILVYATCSLLPEENELQIADFIKEQQDARIHTLPIPWGQKTQHGWQILPGKHNMDGFFYCILQKIPK